MSKPSRCTRRPSRLSTAPRSPDRVLVEGPFDVLDCLEFLAPIDAVPLEGESLVLIERDGCCSRVLHHPSDGGPASLDRLADMLIDAIDDWQLAGVVGVIHRRSPVLRLSSEEVERWMRFGDDLKAGGLGLFDVVFIGENSWGSARWTGDSPPSYRF